MRQIITVAIFFICVFFASAQNSSSHTTLEQIEKLLSHHEIDAADSLLQNSQLSYGNSISLYQADCAVGLLLYNQEKYEEAISVMNVAISKMDSLRLWDCDNYFKTAYYLADSYLHLNKIKESEAVINYALVKCIDSYFNCIYAKKLYQLLLVLYDKIGYSTSVIEQVHNEIQKIAINIYASNIMNQDGQQIKEDFMAFYNCITSPPISKEDSINMNYGKASNLYVIGEYDEAIRLFEKVKKDFLKNDEKTHSINKSLLIMYSRNALTDKINQLLPEMYDYALRKKFDYDFYTLNVLVGYHLNQNGHFREAQYYYHLCDSFLNTKKAIPNWIEKKKSVLSKMVFNCLSLSEYKEVIRYCKEYSKLADSKNYDETFFVNYNKGLALRGLEKYKDAIKVFETLKTYVQKNRGVNNEDYIGVNVLLGICYDRTNRNNDFFECASISVDVYKKIQLDDKPLLSTLYNNLGKAYLLRGEYNKALSFLYLSAEIQIEQTGMVSQNTQSYIDECEKKQK